MTAIEMIAQIKRIGLLALVIYICEIRDICGYFIHEHGRHGINGTSVPSVHFVFVKRKKRIMPIKRRKKLLCRSVSGPLKTQERKH